MTEPRTPETTHRVDPGCDEIRTLMLAEAERDLSAFELGRIERHVSSCDACGLEIAGEANETALVVEALAGIDWPGEREWQELERRVSDEVRPAAAAIRPLAPAPTRPATPAWWQGAIIPAAATLLIALGLLSPSWWGSAPVVSDPEPLAETAAVEIISVPDDSDVMVLTSEDEGVFVFVSSEI